MCALKSKQEKLQERYEQILHSEAQNIKAYCELPPEKAQLMVANLCNKVLPALESISGSVKFSVNTLVKTVISSISCDKTFSPEEYNVALPLLRYAFGEDITYDKTMQIVAEARMLSAESREQFAKIVESISLKDRSAAQMLVTLCFVIICADGFVTDEEYNWRKRLINATYMPSKK